MGEDWDQVLKEALPKLEQAADELNVRTPFGVNLMRIDDRLYMRTY